eukprot:UN03315
MDSQLSNAVSDILISLLDVLLLLLLCSVCSLHKTRQNPLGTHIPSRPTLFMISDTLYRSQEYHVGDFFK